MAKATTSSSLRGISTVVNGRHAFVHERVLVLIARETERNGSVRFLKTDLARRLGCREHTLDRAITRLRREGLVVSTPTFDASGAQRENEYRATEHGMVCAELIRSRSGSDERASRTEASA